MVDKELELKIKRLKEFMQLWIKFHDMYKNSLSRDTISPEEEKSFLETKSLIARKYQALKDQLGIGSSYDDRTFDVISQVLSLKSVAAISDLSMHKIENDWHNSYIQLNKLLGELEGKQEALKKVSRTGILVKNIVRNPYVNLIIAVVVIFLVYFAVKNFVVIPFEESRKEPSGLIEFKQ